MRKTMLRILNKSICISLLVILVTSQASAQAQNPPPPATTASSIYVPEGQLISAPVRVYLAGQNLNLEMQPELYLTISKSFGRIDYAVIRPIEVVPNTKIPGVEGNKVGTLLLFNFRNHARQVNFTNEGKFEVTTKSVDFPWGVSFYPTLRWSDNGPKKSSGETGPMIIVGNIFTALLTICVIVVPILLLILFRTKPIGAVLIGEDGYASLSRTQFMAWTVVAVLMVGAFGLAYRTIPQFPASLVVLMGLALVTTGSVYVASDKENKLSPAYRASGGNNPVKSAKFSLQDLFTSFPTKEAKESLALRAQEEVVVKLKEKEDAVQKAQAELDTATAAKDSPEKLAAARGKLELCKTDLEETKNSTALHASDIGSSSTRVIDITKVQMFLWTVVSLLLFIVKSLLNGDLWIIPWELVALMGISQATYVTSKYWTLGRE